MTTPAKQLKKDRSTGGAARLWALAALLLAVFLGSFFLGRYGVSLTLGQFLGLMAEGLQRVLTALVNWVGKPFGFATERLFAVPVTWSSVMEAIMLNIRMPRIIMACLVGCCLASAGACYQGVFQNPTCWAPLPVHASAPRLPYCTVVPLPLLRCTPSFSACLRCCWSL